ncbi:hypothetical protein [Desulfobacterium sp. N47]|uniref:TIGR04255 family protein n=1 Tax=uncultured Desulfobacterium sp. TaxID=201089 RepID=E1YFW9_9BACT|nr:unknown protein [uncultured Desulfobacterium sp.]
MSKLKPIGWSAVVAGKWNPAILTPKGIAEHIFNKTGDTPIEVLVPLDAMSPVKVKIEGLIISANFERLVIECENNNWESLNKSREYCRKAIESLPKTPLSAAGFNIRYEIEEPKPEFLKLLEPQIDDKISDNSLIILEREIRRSLSWKEGNINLHIVTQEPDRCIILLNFDRKSADNSILTDWLSISIEDVLAITKKIMSSVLKICTEDEL